MNKGDVNFATIKEMVEAITGPAMLLDASGCVIAMNEYSSKRLEMEKKRIQGKSIYALLPDWAGEQLRRAMEEASQSRKMVSYENRVRDRDYQHSVLPVYNQDTSPKAFAVFTTDITEQKSLARQVQENERFLQLILDTLEETVFLTDKKGIIRYVSSNVGRILGLSVEQVADRKNIFKIVNDLHKQISDFDNQDFDKNLQCSIITDDGSRKMVLVTVKYLSLPEDSVLFLCRDISAEVAVKQELEQKNVALSELIKNIKSEKSKVDRGISSTSRKLVFPIVDMIAEKPGCESLARLLKSTIEHMTSPFATKAALGDFNLTQREIQICNMVATGLSIKQIAQLTNTSPLTIEKHRKTIRRKLGISDNKTNLVTYLNSLS